ncbi:MAG: ParA family protein [Candidatus Sumerlaeia bacterium]|nr:ParA family protein [Candidatus Sumerlaeia bacterium]
MRSLNVSRETIPHQPRIAIINQKGGVGKTTTAVNFAHGLALQGRKVLLFDLDPQGNATSSVGVEKYTTNPSSHEFLLAKDDPPPPTPTAYENIDIYPANISLIGAELELSRLGEEQMTSALRKNLKKFNHTHEFILFDAPPSLGLLTLNILVASSHVLVPVQCEYLALEGLSMLLETLDQLRDGHNQELKLLGCVLTMADLRTNLTQEVIRDMRQNLGPSVLETLIPRTIRLSESPSHGKTIFDYERWGVGARAYEALTREVLRRLADEVVKGNTRR